MSPDKAMIGYLQARIAELEAEVERLTVFVTRLDAAKATSESDAEFSRDVLWALKQLHAGVNPSGLSLSAGKPRESDGGKGS